MRISESEPYIITVLLKLKARQPIEVDHLFGWSAFLNTTGVIAYSLKVRDIRMRILTMAKYIGLLVAAVDW